MLIMSIKVEKKVELTIKIEKLLNKKQIKISHHYTYENILVTMRYFFINFKAYNIDFFEYIY